MLGATLYNREDNICLPPKQAFLHTNMYNERLQTSFNSLIPKVISLMINTIQQRFKKKPTDQQPISIHYNILIN